MMSHPARRRIATHGLIQGAENTIVGHAGAHGPAPYHPAVGIRHRRSKQPPFRRPAIGDSRHPARVGPFRHPRRIQRMGGRDPRRCRPASRPPAIDTGLQLQFT
jgi:hypothetical protein